MSRKSQHLSDSRYKIRTSGIYSIVNTINGKMYIGSSVIIEKREKEHWLALRKNKHANRYLQFSVNKYGIDNFEFKILEVNVEDDKLISREQYWMDTLNSIVPNGYNLKPFAASNIGYKPSAESIEKGASKKRGRPLSEETKAKMSAARKGRKQSLEWIAKRTKSGLITKRINFEKRFDNFRVIDYKS